MRICLSLLVSCLVFAMVGCSKSDTVQSPASPPPRNTPGPGPNLTNAIDACSLLTGRDVEAIQGAPLKDAKRSVSSQGGLTVSQCYFLLGTAVDSINVTVTQRADGSNARDPKQAWEEIFHGDKGKEEASKEESKSAPPEKIEGLGDDAFWAPRRFGGALYVLKGNIYVTLSIGGADEKAARIQKSKALAEILLKRL